MLERGVGDSGPEAEHREDIDGDTFMIDNYGQSLNFILLSGFIAAIVGRTLILDKGDRYFFLR